MKYTSTRGQGLNYSPTDVLETFPLPVSTDHIENAARSYERILHALMRDRGLGVTGIFNALNSRANGREIEELREALAELDQVALESYGWTDISLDHGFHYHRQMERWTVTPAARAEILGRLLDQNHERAAAEGPKSSKSTRIAAPQSEDSQEILFGDA